ncbi:hypothetical protein CkaCkLH20_09095 [Colletotrichum karsti]|uniref:Uncharacterized protein n=1 Tax=Colletotrichum karsti TaxID=1095194 RepID=A0A9P6HXX2_9PEZI|nr:uncharacterized protein CkaCkLH20_09095 [Colletotrichum karsti]KAF9873282.1 hypothetical protein CkaCkLH20_09095 [Colletotrichum karsti]
MDSYNKSYHDEHGLPMPFSFSSFDFSVAFRPSPAPSEPCISPPVDPSPEITSAELLRIQPYLKYPGFDLPELVITDKNKSLAAVLRTHRDTCDPGDRDSPVDSDQMPYYVSLQVEAVFAAAVGVLYTNKDMTPSTPLMWQKVQRVLETRDAA